MALLEWTDKMSVGIETIDADHKKMLDLLNTLHMAVREKHPASAVRAVLQELIKYADYHFQAEEQLMRLARYPAFEEHKAKHDALRQQVLALDSSLDSMPENVMRVKTFDFLSEWLMRHILGDDMKYKEALLARAKKPQG